MIEMVPFHLYSFKISLDPNIFGGELSIHLATVLPQIAHMSLGFCRNQQTLTSGRSETQTPNVVRSAEPTSNTFSPLISP